MKKIWYMPMDEDHKLLMGIVNVGIIISLIAFVIGIV